MGGFCLSQCPQSFLSALCQPRRAVGGKVLVLVSVWTLLLIFNYSFTKLPTYQISSVSPCLRGEILLLVSDDQMHRCTDDPISFLGASLK